MKHRIIQGNCLEVMKSMKNKSVDCVITSPPYNMRLRVSKGKYIEREKTNHFSKKYQEFNDALPIEDYYQFHKNVLAELMRVSPIVFWNIQIVTGSKEAIFKIMGHFAEKITDMVIWDKGLGQPAMHSGVLNRGYELIIIFESERKNGRTFNKSYFKRGTLQDIWRLGRGGKGKIKDHTAVFPVSLVETILINFTKKGDIVLDPFLGTGTTSTVCKRLERNSIGIELSERYCALAKERLNNVQNNLF